MGTQLSTTAEGLWLAAALAGITRLPAALSMRPVGDVETALSSHPGLRVFEEAGVCQGRTLDPDVQDWLVSLGRCDVDVSLRVTRPAERADRLIGPPEIFEPQVDPLRDPLGAAEALRTWRQAQPAERTAVLCRREGKWVAAARVWQNGEHPIDEVTICPLEPDTSLVDAICDLLGPESPAEFEGINIEADRLQTVLTTWQRDAESYDVIGELLKLGLTARQARVIVAISDAGATRAAIGASQYSLDGPEFATTGAVVIDSLLGRVVVSTTSADDQQQWIMIFPGTPAGVGRAVNDALQQLPSGTGWESHRRIQSFHTR